MVGQITITLCRDLLTHHRRQRVFFHDVSTADVQAGTGGLDASIGFETMRAENKGAAMNDTLGWYARFYNQNVGSE
jgi:hypothetical protein